MTPDAFPEIAAAYSKAEPELRLVERSLAGFLRLVCDEMSMERHDAKWVRIVDESRVKDAQGLKRALDEADTSVESMWEIDDLVGVRAVVLRLSDAGALAKNLQIIASAGSGKTEAVAQRVTDLLAGHVPPAAIVAFTLTDPGCRIAEITH